MHSPIVEVRNLKTHFPKPLAVNNALGAKPSVHEFGGGYTIHTTAMQRRCSQGYILRLQLGVSFSRACSAHTGPLHLYLASPQH